MPLRAIVDVQKLDENSYRTLMVEELIGIKDTADRIDRDHIKALEGLSKKIDEVHDCMGNMDDKLNDICTWRASITAKMAAAVSGISIAISVIWQLIVTHMIGNKS